jgi:hypothetical protein
LREYDTESASIAITAMTAMSATHTIKGGL